MTSINPNLEVSLDPAAYGLDVHREAIVEPRQLRERSEPQVPQLANLDAERSILGAAMIHAECIRAAGTLQPGDWWEPRHIPIWRAIQQAQVDRGATDPVTVADVLERMGRLGDAGGSHYLLDLQELATAPAAVAVHADIVRDYAQRRSARDAFAECARRIAGGAELEDVVPQLRSVLAPRESRRAPSSPAEVVTRWRDHGPLIHARTGFPTLDAMTGGGFVFGQAVFFAGAPDAGKTAVVVQMLDGWAVNAGYLVGLLAVDEDEDGIATRLLQRRGFDRQRCEGRDHADLDAMDRCLADLPFQLYDENWTIEEAAADLGQRAAAMGVRAVFAVDSLQTVRSSREDSAESLREQVTARAQAIKAAAGEHRMIAISTSEMARAAYRGGSSEPIDDLAAAKESGAIEYAAKVLLAIRTVAGEPGKLLMRIAKNKNGPRHNPADVKDGIYLEIDRQGQQLQETARDPNAAGQQQDAKDAVQDQRRARDAALLAVVVAEDQGIRVKDAEAELRRRVPGRKMGDRRWTSARRELGAALTDPPAGGNGKLLFLDGSKVPQHVLDMVPIASLPKVKSATRSESLPGSPPVSPGLPGGDPGDACERVSPGPYVVGPERHSRATPLGDTYQAAGGGADGGGCHQFQEPPRTTPENLVAGTALSRAPLERRQAAGPRVRPSGDPAAQAPDLEHPREKAAADQLDGSAVRNVTSPEPRPG